MSVGLFGIPRCVCGHHMDAHHTTPRGRSTWCSVWDRPTVWDKPEVAPRPAVPCPCVAYEPQPEEEDQ